MNWVLHVHRTSRPCVMWIASSAVSVDADSLSIYLSSLDACPCGCARCGAPPQRVVMCSGGWLMLALGITQYAQIGPCREVVRPCVLRGPCMVR